MTRPSSLLHDVTPVIEPDPVIEVFKRDIDRTLIRERLKRSFEERLRDLMELARFADELRQAGRRLG